MKFSEGIRGAFDAVAIGKDLDPTETLEAVALEWAKKPIVKERYIGRPQSAIHVQPSSMKTFRATARGLKMSVGSCIENAMRAWMGPDAVAKWKERYPDADAPQTRRRTKQRNKLGVVPAVPGQPKAVPSDIEKGLVDRVRAIYQRAQAGQHQDLLDNLDSHLEKVEAVLAARKGPPASAKTDRNKRRKRQNQE